MTLSDDYLGEMGSNRATDFELDRLLDGTSGAPDGYGAVADLFNVLRAESVTGLDDETVAGWALAAADEAVVIASALLPVPDKVGQKVGGLVISVRRRVATIVASAALLVGGMSGMAVAADSAKPGDLLYGIDRAFEAVGIGNGDADERIEEAEALLEAGEISRGLRHAADTVKSEGPEEPAASVALLDAAERVRGEGPEKSASTREEVAGLITYISENVHDLDGRHVAELAREIGAKNERAGGADRADPPAGPPADPPSPDRGPPDAPGRSDKAPGPPDHSKAEPPGPPASNPGSSNSNGKKP